MGQKLQSVLKLNKNNNKTHLSYYEFLNRYGRFLSKQVKEKLSDNETTQPSECFKFFKFLWKDTSQNLLAPSSE